VILFHVNGLSLTGRRALAVVADTREVAAATKEEVVEDTAAVVEEDTKEVEAEDTVVDETTSDERSTEGMNPEGTITDGTIDPPGETTTVIGVLLEGTTEIGSMIETDLNEPLPPKPTDETRKYRHA
jgi:hypothetical protein